MFLDLKIEMSFTKSFPISEIWEKEILEEHVDNDLEECRGPKNYALHNSCTILQCISAFRRSMRFIIES